MTTTRASVLSWDWREQPDFDALDAMLQRLAGLRLHQVDTGCDQFAIVLTSTALTEADVQAVYDRWLHEDFPDEMEVEAA